VTRREQREELDSTVLSYILPVCLAALPLLFVQVAIKTVVDRKGITVVSAVLRYEAWGVENQSLSLVVCARSCPNSSPCLSGIRRIRLLIVLHPPCWGRNVMKDGFKQTGSIKVWRFLLGDLASAGLAGSKTCLFLTTDHKLLLLSLSLWIVRSTGSRTSTTDERINHSLGSELTFGYLARKSGFDIEFLAYLYSSTHIKIAEFFALGVHCGSLRVATRRYDLFVCRC